MTIDERVREDLEPAPSRAGVSEAEQWFAPLAELRYARLAPRDELAQIPQHTATAHGR